MCRLTRTCEKKKSSDKNYVPIVAIESSICHIENESKKNISHFHSVEMREIRRQILQTVEKRIRVG